MPDARAGPTAVLTTRLAAHPVLAALLLAAVLHLLWWWLLANSGGDIAAQDAWAEFARDHPGSAYNLAWYGGMHPVSYSILSPYLMALAGVRTTMMFAGPLSAALLALVLVRSQAVERPLWPALYGAVALTGNAVSGRVTFGLGTLFALGAVAVVFAWPQRWRTAAPRHRLPRGVLAGLLATLATASSPVAGLFLGIAAAALWLGRRRAAALAVGVPPVLVVAFSAVFFPFSGLQPMGLASMVLPGRRWARPSCCWSPRSWLSVRLGAAVYVVVVLVTWIVPSPIGTNVTRLGAALRRGAPGGRRVRPGRATRRPPLGVAPGPSPPCSRSAIAISSAWQVATAARDAITTAPPAAWAARRRAAHRPARGPPTPAWPGSRSCRAAATGRRPRWRRTSTWPAAGTGRPTPSATRSSTTTRPLTAGVVPRLAGPLGGPLRRAADRRVATPPRSRRPSSWPAACATCARCGRTRAGASTRSATPRRWPTRRRW